MDKKFLEAVANNNLRLSYSSLKQLLESPRHFYNYFTEPKKSSEAMKLGTLVHCLVLEPETFESRYFIADKPDQRTKAGKALWGEILANNEGKDVLDAETFDQAEIMARAVYSKYEAYYFTQCPTREQSFEFEYRGLKIQGIVDALGDKEIIDLKTTANAKPKKFKWAFFDFHYDLQAAIYTLAFPDRAYKVFAVDAFGYVSVHNVTDDTVMIGHKKLDMALDNYETCKFSDFWLDGYEGETDL